MLNQVVLVGRITDIPKEKNKIIIAVQRPYKNNDGVYEVDFISIQLFDSINDNSKLYLTIGDLVGVKGRLQTKENELLIVADKLTYLSHTEQRKEEEGI